jgi:pterin-4a-carbinolamine dehydratase
MTSARDWSDHCRHTTFADRCSETEVEIALQLNLRQGRQAHGNALARTYRFGNCYEPITFINAHALVIRREDHPAELQVGCNSCEVRINKHSAGGSADGDLTRAAEVDAIFAQSYPA